MSKVDPAETWNARCAATLLDNNQRKLFACSKGNVHFTGVTRKKQAIATFFNSMYVTMYDKSLLVGYGWHDIKTQGTSIYTHCGIVHGKPGWIIAEMFLQ
jgi:hypothetical protein